MVRLAALLLTFAAAACASTLATPQPFPRPVGGASEHPRLPRGPQPGSAASGAEPVRLAVPQTRYAIAGTALSLRGTPYQNGGSDPSSGFDCSGLVWYVFTQHGVSLPRSVSDQYRAGTGIAFDTVEPGDLVFFSTTAPGPSHVGIAIGGDAFVHAPSPNGQVRVEHLSAGYWSSRYLGARRLSESVK